MKRTLIWIGALVVGAILGLLGSGWLDEVMNFVATVYTRLFQLLAVPTIVLAVITTFAAAVVGAVLYVLIDPSNLPCLGETLNTPPQQGELEGVSYSTHFLSVIPNNIIKPFLEGNVLSLLLLAFAVGIGLSKLPESENKAVVVKGLHGL